MHAFQVSNRFSVRKNKQNKKTKLMSTFEALPDTPSKVRFVQSWLEDANLMMSKDGGLAKDDFASKLHRDSANHLYREKKFVDALIGYNKALCFADTEGLGLCYANRSAVFLELKLYDECLDNIRLAREANYPANLLSKLVEREEKCRAAISIKRPVAKVKKLQPKLSYPVSAENPGVADCIELMYNKKYGRHFIAKQNLKVGDVVMLDRSYQDYLLDDYIYQRCANCLKENNCNLTPCPDCTNAMFCSRSCLESAGEKFHKILCPVVKRSVEQNGDEQASNTFFALRIILSLMHDFGDVKAVAAARSSRSVKTLLPKWGGDEQIQQKNALDAFHDMEPDFEPMNHKDATHLALVYSWAMDYTELALLLPDVDSQDLFLDLMYRYNRIIETTSHSTHTMDCDKNGMLQLEPIAWNILPIISLLNHSCASNTIGISYNESLTAAMIERPVKKGEQLFVSYDAHHLRDPKIVRQQKLLKSFNFVCDCVACVNDYPLLSNIPRDPAPAHVTMDCYDYFHLSDEKKALQKLKDCKKYLEKKDPTYPSKGLYMVRIGMLQEIFTLCHNYTLKVSSK